MLVPLSRHMPQRCICMRTVHLLVCLHHVAAVAQVLAKTMRHIGALISCSQLLLASQHCFGAAASQALLACGNGLGHSQPCTLQLTPCCRTCTQNCACACNCCACARNCFACVCNCCACVCNCCARVCNCCACVLNRSACAQHSHGPWYA